MNGEWCPKYRNKAIVIPSVHPTHCHVLQVVHVSDKMCSMFFSPQMKAQSLFLVRIQPMPEVCTFKEAKGFHTLYNFRSKIGTQQSQDGASSVSRTNKHFHGIAKRLRRSCANGYFCATFASRQKFRAVSTDKLMLILAMSSMECLWLKPIYSRGRCRWNASTQPFPPSEIDICLQS